MNTKIVLVLLFIAVIASIGVILLKVSTNKSEVSVPENMRLCQVDSECTYVETRCNSCCGYIGINKEYKNQFYEEIFSPNCRNYRGAVCDCVGPTEAYCLNGICNTR